MHVFAHPNQMNQTLTKINYHLWIREYKRMYQKIKAPANYQTISTTLKAQNVLY